MCGYYTSSPNVPKLIYWTPRNSKDSANLSWGSSTLYHVAIKFKINSQKFSTIYLACKFTLLLKLSDSHTVLDNLTGIILQIIHNFFYLSSWINPQKLLDLNYSILQFISPFTQPNFYSNSHIVQNHGFFNS